MHQSMSCCFLDSSLATTELMMPAAAEMNGVKLGLSGSRESKDFCARWTRRNRKTLFVVVAELKQMRLKTSEL